MHSLYHSLLAQHARQLTPIRCNQSTIAQLHRYFEDVVIENNLGAMVAETLPAAVDRSPREIARMRMVAKAARDFFLFVTPEDPLARLVLAGGKESNQPVVVRQLSQSHATERFVVVADARFSALLASIRPPDSDDATVGDLVVWSFEPNVVYSALEYLMARVTAENSFHAAA